MGSESSTGRRPYETQYVCPRCRKIGPRDAWDTNPRQGTMRCPVCVTQGALDIIPEEAGVGTCLKCGGRMTHYRLKGYRCPVCD